MRRTIHPLSDEDKDFGDEIQLLDIALPDSDGESDYESLSEPDTEDDEIEEVKEGTTSTFPDAGKPIGDAEKPLYDELQPWWPFDTKNDFKLARWFIQSGTSRDQINQFFANKLGCESSFTSSHTLMQKVDQMESGLGWSSWKSGEVYFDSQEEDDEEEGPDELRPRSDSAPFYYRDIVACVAYLLAQPCYNSDMVYAPIREANSEGHRMYSEMHTADWWWDIQVRPF